MLAANGQLVNSPDHPRQLHIVRGMNASVMKKMPVHFLSCKGVQMYGENAFLYIIKLYPELSLRYQVGINRDPLRAQEGLPAGVLRLGCVHRTNALQCFLLHGSASMYSLFKLCAIVVLTRINRADCAV